MVSLNITLDQVINYANSLGVSEVTYHCPANKYSCYYDYSNMTIHINMNAMEHTYETLGCYHNIWLNDLDEAQIYSILHELGHHIQPSHFRLKSQRYQAEVDAWERASTILQELNEKVPDNFYVYRDFKLKTYDYLKHDAQDHITLDLALADLRRKKEKLINDSTIAERKLNIKILSFLSVFLLVGGTIVYRSLVLVEEPELHCTTILPDGSCE
jgi:hypothetical protein